MKEIIIDGNVYVKKDCFEIAEFNIVILQRGWCMVGRLIREGSDCKLLDASVIRRWGTEKGLGEIAKNGPTNETILDKCHGIVKFDWLTVIASIECDQEKWKKDLLISN